MTLTRAACCWLGSLALLAGCASVGERSTERDHTITGKLSVRVDASATAPARSEGGNFELKGTAERGELNLSTPLGTVVAQARWAGRQAWLATAQGETAYADLDSLTQDMLGERLPMAALFDWLRGQPWSGAASQPVAQGFRQLGWTVDVSQLTAEGVIAAQRPEPPAIVVRARIDKP